MISNKLRVKLLPTSRQLSFFLSFLLLDNQHQRLLRKHLSIIGAFGRCRERITGRYAHRSTRYKLDIHYIMQVLDDLNWSQLSSCTPLLINDYLQFCSALRGLIFEIKRCARTAGQCLVN